MNSKYLFIYDSIKLFEILNEIKENLNFEINYINKRDFQKMDFYENKNYLIITTESSESVKNSLVIDNLPKRINDLIETVNLRFLKNHFNNQSEIKIGKYILNLNSRKINFKKINLDFTEKECNLILFIQANKSASLKEIQKNVWHYKSDLETHTVETHIYRIRKKMIKSFRDDNFIKFNNKGYFLS